MKRYSAIAAIIFSVIMLIVLFRFRMPILLTYLIAINLTSFLLYGMDKLAAIYKWQRIPENLLHLLAFGGGSPLALVAQQLFNHKTSKRQFLVAYWIIVLLQAALIYAVFYTDLLKQVF